MRTVFDRVFIIMLENELERAVLLNDYMCGLQARGVRLRDYHGVTHPSLAVVVFDESIPCADNYVYCALLGDMVKAETIEADHYDHYGLLRTIEENFGLGTLERNDLTANWFRFLWGLQPPAFRLSDHVQ
jgi:hypothetical protein